MLLAKDINTQSCDPICLFSKWKKDEKEKDKAIETTTTRRNTWRKSKNTLTKTLF